MSPIKLAAVVVLYQPSISCVTTIRSFYRDIDVLFLYQNSLVSPEVRQALNEQFGTKVYWLGDCTNQGIGAALNEAARKALEVDCQLLLTMDQDSQFAPGHFGHYAIWAKQLYPSYPLMSPNHKMLEELSFLPRSAPAWVMTSGNIVCIQTLLKLGGFNERFFIDGIDMEFCLRLSRSYSFAIFYDIFLEHQLGSSQKHRWFRKYVTVTHHSPTRHFYMCRNYLLIANMALTPADVKKGLKRTVRRNLKYILLFESDKWQKITMYIKGYWAYRNFRGIV